MPEFTITEVRNAKSLDESNTWFDVEINHPKFGWIPYTLSPDDTDQTVSNDEILALIGSDFAPHVPPTQEELYAAASEAVRQRRDFLLQTEVDPIVSNPLRWNDMTAEQQQTWSDYRRALLDITLHANFPYLQESDWPIKPQ